MSIVLFLMGVSLEIMAQYIGFLAATLTTVAFLPQAWKVHRTKSCGDLSLGLFLIFSVGVFTWLIYGILVGDWPIIVANVITFVLAFYILSMKILEMRRRSLHCDVPGER